ncbi:hypothetical protein SAY87_011043 [Trapa incisa]|uniref:Uncharacterized protein n=1 Tax=Trapa incisa TaxID=236973 RepID=A0AAN7GFI4_9MYRT|nr:hypothetical protein SAY87_011043 [Trapa incisa]
MPHPGKAMAVIGGGYSESNHSHSCKGRIFWHMCMFPFSLAYIREGLLKKPERKKASGFAILSWTSLRPIGPIHGLGMSPLCLVRQEIRDSLWFFSHIEEKTGENRGAKQLSKFVVVGSAGAQPCTQFISNDQQNRAVEES